MSPTVIRRFSILSGVLFWIAPLPAHAQDAPDLWQSRLEFGFNGSSGNSSFGILRTGGSITRVQPGVVEFELSALVRYGKNEDQVIADDMRGTTRVDWKPDSDFSPFAFVTASRDRIRKLDLKVDGGVGATWTFHRGDSDGNTASLSLAGALDYEDFLLATGSTAQETDRAVRASARVKFDHEFGSGATFGHVTFWQPEVSSFGDYVVTMTNSLSTALLSNLSLAIEHEYLHDEVPPPGAEPDDQKFSVVLRVSL